MPQYFRRAWKLHIFNENTGVQTSQDFIINPMFYNNLRIVFNITYDAEGGICFADIALYNLSKNSGESRLFEAAKYQDTVELSAGYYPWKQSLEDQGDINAAQKAQISRIFKGTIFNATRDRQGADTIIRILATGDNGKVLGKEPYLSFTLGAGENITQVFTKAAQAMNLQPQYDKRLFQNDTVPAGFPISGNPKNVINTLSQMVGFNWIIMNDKLIITKEGHALDGTTIISMNNGMEGVPEINESGCTVKTRLNPQLQINHKFKIESDFKHVNFQNLYVEKVPENLGEGEYGILKIEHTGDSHGDMWTTNVTGVILELDSSLVAAPTNAAV